LKLGGSYMYAGQYQQRPAPAGGGIFNRNWWKHWEALPELETVVISLDCAFKGAEDSDFVVLQVWGKTGASFYLLDQARGQMNFPTTVAALEAMTQKWPAAAAKLVEDKANGSALIDTLKNRIPGLIAIEPRGSKEARASAVSPFVEAGNVFLPPATSAPWIADFLSECSAFPRGSNDDQVDAMTQALDRLANGGDGVADWYARKAEEIQKQREARNAAK
jgi:predicted phage terminase large subunit-like protein